MNNNGDASLEVMRELHQTLLDASPGRDETLVSAFIEDRYQPEVQAILTLDGDILRQAATPVEIFKAWLGPI